MANKPRVILVGNINASAATKSKLDSIAEVHTLPPMADGPAKREIEALVEQHGPFVAFAGCFTPPDPFPFRWNKSLLGALLSECKLFVSPGVGTDTIDIPYLTSQGAFVANSPREMGRRTADGALVLILAVLKGLTPREQACREGKYNTVPVRSLDWRSSTIGIIGLGNIGRQIAQMCSMLGMKIIYHNRSPDTSSSFDYAPLEELYKRSDLVLLSCPLTIQTRGMINKESIGKMKDGVVIVNVARGAVVKEQDLIDALESGKVLRAALDVFENEPEIHPALLTNPNVTLSPHTICATEDIFQAVANEVLENIIAYLQTGKPNTPVNLAALQQAGLVV